MSSSDEKRVGTIFMGPDKDRETTLEKLYGSSGRQGWTKQTENDYLDRVRAKATQSVKALLVEARKRAEIIEQEADHIRQKAEDIRREAEAVLDEARQARAEAQAIREAAQREGLVDAREQARGELEQTKKELGETTALVLLGIHEQCGHIFDAWRDELADLLKEAVHKSSGLLIDQNRAEVLESLLDKSMKALLDRREYTVLVHPSDKDMLVEIMGRAHKSMPRTANWEVSTDPDLEPGSLVVESDSALVNNSQQTRRSVVDEVLEHLGIPLSQADQDAFSQVTTTLVTEMSKNGVHLHEADAAQSSEPFAAANPEESAEERIRPDQEFAPGFETDTEASAAPEADFAEGPEFLPEQAGQSLDEQAEDSVPAPEPAGAEAATETGSQHDQVSQAEAQDMVAEFLGEDNDALLPEPLAEADGLPEPAFPPSENAPVSEPEQGGLDPDLADELLAEMGFAPNAAALPERTED